MNVRRHILVAAILIIAACVAPSSSGADDLVVGSGGSYLMPSDALEAARDGDRIVIRPGVYRDTTLVVERRVTILGEEGAVLDGERAGTIMLVRADSVVIIGLHFRNVAASFVDDRAAIRVENAARCRIESNAIEGAFFGIYLGRSSGCVIRDNRLDGRHERESRAGNGIHVWNSRDVTIERNYITRHRDGIYLEFASDSRMAENESVGNLRYGLHFMFSDACTYDSNRFVGNDAGVAVMYSKHVEMTGNLFSDNRGSAAYGLLLKEITDSVVRDNVIARNTIGMFAEGSNRMTVERNTFESNGWAVKILANAEANEFVRNRFIANSFDVSTNSRQAYSTFRENYWDSYRGYDLDGDGYGDVPHHPVRLFSVLVERNEPALLLLRSPFVALLDMAEAVFPALTPDLLIDESPLMRKPL